MEDRVRTILVGDVHGCLVQLWELMGAVGLNNDDRVILLGDMVDRGPDSPGCLSFAKVHGAIMGNHEYKHVRYRAGILKKLSPSQVQARQQWLDRELDYHRAVDFMETLPFYLELPEITLVHAGVEYGIPMEDQDRIVLIGGQSKRHLCGIDTDTGLPYWCAKYPASAKPIAFGHLHIDPAVVKQDNLFPLDTGCCHGGELTALTLPDFRRYSVPGWQPRWKR